MSEETRHDEKDPRPGPDATKEALTEASSADESPETADATKDESNDAPEAAKAESKPKSAKDAPDAKSAKDTKDPPNDGSPVPFAAAVATMLLALVLGEATYRRSTLPKTILVTDTYQVKSEDYKKRGGSDVIIVGSSRIYHGAMSPLIAQLASDALGKPISVYNMGIPSGDVPGYVLTAEDVLRKGLKTPTLFVFAMSPIEWTCCPATSLPSSARWVSSVRPNHALPLFVSASDPEEAFTDLTIGLFQSYGSRTHVLNKLLRNETPPWRADPGSNGWVSFGWPVDPGTQNARATGRAAAYAPYFYAPMHFDRKGTHKYFMHAVDRLESRGVKIAIVGTPQARQLDRNNDDVGYYPQYVAYLTEQAKLHGTEFVNFNSFPGLTNADFADGDHLVEMGAAKFSRLLAERVIIPALRGEKPKPL